MIPGGKVVSRDQEEEEFIKRHIGKGKPAAD
jgi:hypothetical protein